MKTSFRQNFRIHTMTVGQRYRAAIALLLLILSFCLLPGCASVPRTEITFNPKTHSITIQSPKDVELTNLTVAIDTNGAAAVRIDSYRSRNNIEAIQAIATQNIEMTKAIGAIGAQVIADTVSKIK